MLQSFYILIPESVPLKRIEQSNVNPNICKGILYLILKKQAYKLIAEKDIKSITSQNLSVSIHSDDLGKLFGNGYTKALEILHKKILFKFPYSDSKSFSFSYNDIHLHKKLIINKIESDTTANKGIVKRMREFYNKNSKMKKLKKFQYLIKFFDPERLKIDFEEALKDNEESYTPTTRKKDSSQYSQYVVNAVKILDIQNGVYWFSHNPKTDGRFHHNLLNLNKKFRKYITYDNQRLVEFDLSNSTPFILSSLLANNFTTKYIFNNYINNITLLNNTLINTKTYFSINTIVSYMSEKIPEYISDKEIQDFLDSCIKGDIYLSISEEYLNRNIHFFYENHFFDLETGERNYTDEELKKVVKKDFLGMLFAENKDYQPMQEAFKKNYPGIYKLLFEIKQKFPYQSLSYLLFQVESYVMLDLLAKDFNKKNRGRLPFFTFHDCLVVQERNEKILEDYMRVRLAEIYKKPPHFKFKKW